MTAGPRSPRAQGEPEPAASDDPWRFFCAILTREAAPLLVKPALARATISLLQAAAQHHRAQLWGYVILPDGVQFVVEVEVERDYHLLVEMFKETSLKALVGLILARYDDLLDAITLFHPAWGEPIYQIWQTGYHTQLLHSPYAVSNKVADLVYRPVAQGLVSRPEDWPFSSYRPAE